ncbi:hypothetical protein OIV83_002065 [Microbotryomycetes sp. JL201]|nr:hypothetical protein OIV83_002065 [Microbotryomycetes sp. JL201]
MRLPWDNDVSSDSESEAECEVRWAVKSVLELDKQRRIQPNARQAEATGSATAKTPAKQASTSAAASKRTTNAAELPSPSSTSTTKPLRARKQRRSSARCTDSPLDANTLRLVGELAKRLNDTKNRTSQPPQQETPLKPQQQTPQTALRPRSINSPSVGAGTSRVGPGKVTRSTHLKSTHLPTPTSLPRGNIATSLCLTATKPSLQGCSPLRSTRSKSLTSNTSTSTANTISTKATDELDEFDALLNADDETSFELALTQLDEAPDTATAAIKRPNLPRMPMPPGPALTRASPRLASRNAKVRTTSPRDVNQTAPTKSAPLVQRRDMFSAATINVGAYEKVRSDCVAPKLPPRRPLARTESSKSRTDMPQDQLDELFDGVEWNDEDF